MTELLENEAAGPTAQLGTTEWRTRLLAIEQENAQLREALSSRILIEQAKGILAERFSLDPGSAFELLRRAARSNRVRIHVLAGKVIASCDSPAEIQRIASTTGRSKVNGKSRQDAKGEGR